MCAEPLGREHSHLADLIERSVRCACRGCHLLFTRQGAARGRYRAVPERYLHDPHFPLAERQWDRLQVPVRMVFLLRNAEQERTLACYPSPAGATEALPPPGAAEEIRRLNPALADPADDVEALLLHRHEGRCEAFLLPIDACYRLVGLIRTRWKGFDGGSEAWQAVGGFFAELRGRSRPVASEPQGGAP